MALKNQSFANRLKKLCNDYYETFMETPLVPESSMQWMNSLPDGTVG